MKTNSIKFSTLIFGVAVSLSACTGGTKTTTTTDSTITDSTLTAGLKPAGPAPEWGKTIKPEMQDRKSVV